MRDSGTFRKFAWSVGNAVNNNQIVFGVQEFVATWKSQLIVGQRESFAHWFRPQWTERCIANNRAAEGWRFLFRHRGHFGAWLYIRRGQSLSAARQLNHPGREVVSRHSHQHGNWQTVLDTDEALDPRRYILSIDPASRPSWRCRKRSGTVIPIRIKTRTGTVNAALHNPDAHSADRRKSAGDCLIER